MPISDDSWTDGDSTMSAAVIVVLTMVAIGGITDLLLDKPTNWWSGHVLLEIALVATSMCMAVVLWLRGRSLSTELHAAHETIVEREAEVAAWRSTSEEALRSFSEAVGLQLTRWELTPSEREVALLLLQGLGHKQIAGRTDRSERTVRQHAVSVYSKSGQRGRAELAAFFLAGLTLPDDTPTAG